MKTQISATVFLIAILVSNINLQAQTTTTVIGTPDDSFGYLIWTTDTSKVKFYKYEFTKTDFLDDDYNELILDRGEIWRQNHILVPYEYFKPSDGDRFGYSYRLTAVDHHNKDLPDIAMGPVGGMGYDVCYWQCHSKDWAFRINQKNMPNGTKNYTLKMAYDIEEEGYKVPFYRYFSSSEFQAYTGHMIGGPSVGYGNPQYHNVGCWPQPYSNICAVPQDIIVAYENTGSAQFFDNTGALIISEYVYGIQKGLGPWYPSSPHVLGSTADYCDGPGNMSTSLEQMMTLLNEDIHDTMPHLHCPILLGGYTGSLPNNADDPPGTIGPGSNNGPCHNVWTYGPWMGLGFTDFYSHHIHCERDLNNTSNNSGTEGLGAFAEDLVNCQVYKLVRFDRTGAVIVAQGSASTFVTASGSPNIPTHNFQPGIHRLTIKLPNEPQKYMVFEVKEASDFTVEHKDFFSGSIFPNPHQDNHFNITIETSARLRVVYELFDSGANRIHRQSFTIPKDHLDTHKVEPDNGLPYGYLYHKFTFEDGSTKSYITIR